MPTEQNVVLEFIADLNPLLFIIAVSILVMMIWVASVRFEAVKKEHAEIVDGLKSQIDSLEQEVARLKQKPPSTQSLVARAAFGIRPVLNSTELSLFRQLDDIMRKSQNGYRVFPQVGLGGYVTSEYRVYKCYSDMRPDFTIVDRSGHPVLALEYNGPGHYGKNAIHRDALKRAVLEKAGIPLEVISRRMDHYELTALLTRHLATRFAA